jgi:bifunctional oligoribonuclease and PAP phosphatase NrnA
MDYQRFEHLLGDFRSFLLTTHLNPDGDGLGSQLALGEYLADRGKTVRLVNHSPTPRHYTFLDPSGDCVEVFSEKEHAAYIENADCIIVLDTNVPSRLGDMEPFVRSSSAVKIVIDHHLDKDEFADHYFVDIEAAATGEIVYHILSALTRNRFTDSMAVGLYTAIMTDTGSFRFPKTTRATHLITAELLQYKVDPAYIYREVYERGPMNRMILFGKALSSIELHHDGRLAVMSIPKEEFEATGSDVTETDGFVNYAMQIDTVEIGILFTETADQVKISFRARGNIWVNELAKEFNGNGHQHAAGATIPEGDLKELIHRAIDRTPRYLP